MRRPSKLIVPIRDRRQHTRILTLKNFAMAVLALAILVAGFSFDDVFRRQAKGDYGRLVGGEMPDTPIAQRKPDIVREAPVVDQSATEPMVIVPAATAAPVAPPVPAPPIETRGSGSGVAIVGDSGGVTVVRGAESPPRRVLAGGIFKQP